MARQRIDRKELKAPDQFLTKTAMVFEWAKAHMREILYGSIGVVVLVGIIVGWVNWQRSRHDQAAELLHEALKLAKPATPPPNTPNAAPSAPSADLDQAIEKLVTITENYDSTPAGVHAYWHLGHLYFAKGDAKSALKAYEEAQRRFPRKHQLSVALATLNVAYAREATGDCEQAIASYESVQQSSIGWLHGDAYLGMGRCYESSGNKDKAIAVYDRALADNHVNSQTQEMINERLAQLQPPVHSSDGKAKADMPTSNVEAPAEEAPAKKADETSSADTEPTEKPASTEATASSK